MQVMLDIPDSLADQFLAAGRDPARAALEALMVEGYRIRQISEGQIKRVLGYGTRMQVHELLAEHGVPLNYDLDEYQKDLATLRRHDAHEASHAA